MKRFGAVVLVLGCLGFAGCAELKEVGKTIGDGARTVVAEAGEAVKAGIDEAVKALPEAGEKVLENPTPAGAGNAVLYVLGAFATGAVGYLGYKKVKKA